MLGFSAIGQTALAQIPRGGAAPPPPPPPPPPSPQPSGGGFIWDSPKKPGKPLRPLSRREMRELLAFTGRQQMTPQERRAYRRLLVEFQRATDDEDVAFLLLHDTLTLQ